MREGVAGIGVDRLDRRIARGEMVGVRGLDALPVAFRGLDQHAIGPHLPDHAADVSAQFMGDRQLAVDVVEEPHIRDPEDRARGSLLGLPDGRGGERKLSGVVSADGNSIQGEAGGIPWSARRQ
jgi:hypothetical protein